MNMAIKKKPDGFGKNIVTCIAKHHGKVVATSGGGVFAKGEDAKFIKAFIGRLYDFRQ